MRGGACRLAYTTAGRERTAAFAAGDGWADDALRVVPSSSEDGSCECLRLQAHAARPLTLSWFSLELPFPDWIEADAGTFVNGYQSWSRSEVLTPRQRQTRLLPVAGFLKPYGDPVPGRPVRAGRFRSWSLTGIDTTARSWFLGSIAERSGFTYFEIDWRLRRVRAVKDCAGRALAAGAAYDLLGLFAGEGPLREELYAAFAAACGVSVMPRQYAGWTSWYYYYTRVGADDIRRVAADLRQLDLPLDFVMIDDGYEAAVGDWFTVNSRFPGGMKRLAAEIEACGYNPALWVAPFIAERRSELWRRHPDWFLRDERGRPVSAGYNPNWSGTFYALDLEQPEPRSYVAEVLRAMTGDWGYRLLKVDFVYAACLRPSPGRTRGEAMAAAVDLLLEAAGGRPILGCGIPLGSAWGRIDLCRIGADTAPYWYDRKLRLLGHQERVATENALASVVNSAGMDKCLLLNDPDVCFLRRRENRLTARQRETLFLLTYLCGSVFTFSDPPSLIEPAERALLRRAFPLANPELRRYVRSGRLHLLRFDLGGELFLVLANLGGRRLVPEWPADLAGTIVFDQVHGEVISDGAAPPELSLCPYESKLLKISRPGPLQVVGTTLHLLGGRTDVAELVMEGDDIRITMAPGINRPGAAWVALPAEDERPPRIVKNIVE